ncbi:MAG: STAS domain-containing protein [Thermoleophilaceae bacterium]
MNLPHGQLNFAIRDEAIDADTAVISLSGDVDMHTAPMLKRRMTELIHEGRRRFIVDLSQVAFIDSTAIGVLVGRRKDLLRRRGTIALVCSDENVLEIFEIAGLPALFEIHESRERALEARVHA